MSKSITNLTVKGMSCNHCKNSIIKSVGEIRGVYSVKVDLENEKVTVEYDSDRVSLDIIINTIEEQGYDVEK